MDTVITWMRQNWGWLLSFLTFGAGVIKYLAAQRKANNARMEALELGVQALLRAQMVSDYNRYSEKGFAPIYARENFENCWKQYERLGANGVLCDLHNKFMALPTEV